MAEAIHPGTASLAPGGRGAESPSTKSRRVVVLGAGFGGLFAVGHLEKMCRRMPDVEIVLVSRDNYFLMTPLLFEACSGAIELRHAAVPIRAFLRSARFVEAEVVGFDLDRRTVRLDADGREEDLSYDQLVLALGSTTNRATIPGSEHAFTFKTLADAVVLRNHLIERFERAATERDPARKARLLTFVAVGGGLVGVELFGEMTAFVDEIAALYPTVRRAEVRFVLIEAGDRLMPEVDEALAAYAHRTLGRRAGAEIRVGAKVAAIEPGAIRLEGETIAAETIVLAAGIAVSPVLTRLDVEKDKKGRIVADPTFRSRSRPEVWALGDCASVPGPDGKPYPALAQFALRMAKVLAGNVAAALRGEPPKPFEARSLGVMAALGHGKGLGQILKLRVRGLPAWLVWRGYYLLQTPGLARKLRILSDWTISLLLPPDVVKLDVESRSDDSLATARPAPG